MPLRKGSNVPMIRSRSANKYRLPIFSLLFISVVTPLVFLAAQNGNFSSTPGRNDFVEGTENAAREHRKLSAIEQIENMFPKEVIDAILSNTDDSGPLSLNAVSRKSLSSSWVIEKPTEFKVLQTTNDTAKAEEATPEEVQLDDESEENSSEINTAFLIADSDASEAAKAEAQQRNQDFTIWKSVEDPEQTTMEKVSPAQNARRQMRLERRVKRLKELTRQDEAAAARLEKAAIERTKEIGVSSSVLTKYSIWRRESTDNSDSLVRLMRDQLIMARVYAYMAQAHKQLHLLNDLRIRIRETQRTLGEANADSDLPRSASERVKSMGQMLSKAREQLYDCTAINKKLRAMLQSSEEQARVLKKQSTFLSQLAAKMLPKGIHCVSMRLTVEYYRLHEDRRVFPGQDKLEDNNLFHYALFSDNILAASVVVNSTVRNAKEPWKHVFHLVTDKLNFAAMKMWFLANPPGNATVDIQNIDEFEWLNSSYCPVLRQLESAAMKEYYFKADHSTTLAAGSSNLKYRNPKYLSMLNHLRFYLPQVYPKLNKILFLDDDIIVQKDLTRLWSVNLGGKVNGAVETCGHSFHRFDKYLNFSNSHIKRNFDSHACGWAYGMNVFDLQQWKKKDITGIYHRWQNLNEDRILWKLGTLPPGLITFYNLTHALDKSWHVLGLGYNPSVDRGEIEGAAVIHYNGNLKPWLELALTKYKSYWTRYVKYDDHFLQQCNINQWN